MYFDTGKNDTCTYIESEDSERGNSNSYKMRQSVFSCLGNNISIRNMSSIISSIIKFFTDEEILQLPSISTIHKLIREGWSICNKNWKKSSIVIKTSHL